MTQPEPLELETVDESRVERILARVLATGVVISAAFIAFGFLASFVVGWTGSLLGAPTVARDTTDFSGLATRLLQLQPLALVQAGLVVLVATPVFRVVVSVVAFWRQHDRLYVGITLLVLFLLLVSLGLLR